MRSSANMLAMHASNECMWETTDYDNIGSLFGKEDLICTHFYELHLEESDDEYDYDDSDESIDTPLVKKVADKHTDKFVFDHAEELLPSPPHDEPKFCTTIHPTNPMLGTTEAEQDTHLEHLLQHDV